MAGPVPTLDGPLPMLGVTVRRATVVGRTYLIASVGPSLIYGALLSLVPGNAFETAMPILLPIFTITGAMGTMLVFTNDRQKGVLEYLLAYGISPRQQFLTILAAALVLLTLLMSASSGLSLAIYLATGHTLTATLAELILFYSFPMGYASAAFATMAGMYWTSLSSPRSGMNSPLGLLPLIGILPSLLTLGAVGADPGRAGYILAAAIGLLTVVVISLLALVERLLPRESLLSPA